MDKRVIRGIYLYEFKLSTTAKEADEKINAAFGQGCSTIRTAYCWYQKFRNGDESLEEHEGRGRHSDVDEDKLRDVVEEDPHKGTREIAKVLGMRSVGLLLLLFFGGCTADLFTAIADMQRMLGAEKEVTNIIEKYIDAEQKRLDDLKR
ncbi:unnamed protein product [Heligmosomoides polygyrus]|uniref:HTH_48 domain-containing protein n=1 Tax=Heligmosomoides polygyrus TaxID=6339 RepID=A0A183FS75_HELPZ|nr:unnamed protein product [Heligmosomoides polygyrus]